MRGQDIGWVISLICASVGLAACVAPSEKISDPTARVETLVAGAPLHGITGLTWGPDDMLYAAAMSSQTVSRIDPKTGAVETLVPPPHGESDDVAVGPDGTLVWTAMFAGELRVKRPDGSSGTLATDFVGVNPVMFSPEGRLFTVVMGTPNRLYEIDLANKNPPRLVTDKIKKLNSFSFDADGYLIGPFWLSGEIVKLDVDTGVFEIIARGLGEPAAIELDSVGAVISANYYTGEVKRTDPTTGVSTLINTLTPPLDNLAVGPDNTIYVSDSGGSGVYVIAPDGTLKDRLTGGEFTIPGGLALMMLDGRETLLVADNFGYRSVDLTNGTVVRAPFTYEFGTGMDIAASGHLIAMTDARVGRVHVFDRSKQKLLFESKGFDAPLGVAFLPNQDVLIAEFGSGSLVRWNGNEVTVITEDLLGPVGLALEANSTILLTENEIGAVTRVDLVTGQTTRLFEGLTGPEGLAVMADGRVAVVEVGASRVVALDLDKSTLSVLADGLDLGVSILMAPDSIGVPTGIAIAADGSLYVSEDGANGIIKIIVSDM